MPEASIDDLQADDIIAGDIHVGELDASELVMKQLATRLITSGITADLTGNADCYSADGCNLVLAVTLLPRQFRSMALETLILYVFVRRLS